MQAGEDSRMWTICIPGRIMDGVVVLELVGAAHMAMASIRQVH